MKMKRAMIVALGVPMMLSNAFSHVPSLVDRRRATFLKSKADDVNGAVNGVNGMDISDPDDPSSFLVGILGDLHIDPRKMDHYSDGRSHWLPIFEDAKNAHGNAALVSLGDLGESKNCDHNDINPSELFAGTTICHDIASEFLGSFGVPYEVIGGNHDLEGIDEVCLLYASHVME